MKKNKAPTTRRGPKEKKHDTNAAVQRQRLLQALREAGSDGINTIQARHDLNIMMPAARVHELRHGEGLNIQTIWTDEDTPEGYTHRVARYVLMAGKYQGVA